MFSGSGNASTIGDARDDRNDRKACSSAAPQAIHFAGAFRGAFVVAEEISKGGGHQTVIGHELAKVTGHAERPRYLAYRFHFGWGRANSGTVDYHAQEFLEIGAYNAFVAKLTDHPAARRRVRTRDSVDKCYP